MSTPENPQDPYGQQPQGGGHEPQQPAGGYGSTPPPPGGYGSTPPPSGGYGAPPPAYGAPAPGYGYAPANTQDNQLGIWSLVLGIASIVMCLGPLAGIPAIILGKKAKTAVVEGRANNESLAKWGVILGWIGSILIVVVGIIYVVGFAALIANAPTTSY